MVKKISVFSLIVLNLITAASFAFSESEGKEAVSRKVLGNGLIILAKEYPSQGLVSINVNIKTGSSLEGDYLGCGISHFVEHMIFKGTKARRPGDIEREIKSYGGFINGSASKDLTDFRITVPAAHYAKALALLKDMLLNAVFDKTEFEKEREVILKEINLNKDEPQSQLSRLLYETAYIRHPYRYPIIGYDDKVRYLKIEGLVGYYEKTYVPNKIVIAVAGDIDSSEAHAAVEKEFKDFRPPDYREDIRQEEPVQISSRYAEREGSVSLSYLAMAFHSTRLLDKDLFAMDVLSIVLGAGDDSHLNKALRKEKELVYSIAAWNYTPEDPGLFVITAVLDRKNLEEAQRGIMEEIDKIKKGMIDEKDLEAAKRMVISDYIFSRETVEEQASDIAVSEAMTGDYDFSRRYVDGVKAVSKEELKRAASLYLTEDNLTSVRLVPSYPKAAEEKAPGPAARKDVIRREVLPNGVRVLLREEKKVPTVSVSVVFLGGLLTENDNNNGISNLTSRMLLKGTTSRKEGEIKGAIERLGGNIDSFSGLNSFGLNTALLKDDLYYGLNVLSDIVANSVFPEGELDKEKALIYAAIKDEDDDIFRKGYNSLRKELFGRHPYGLRVIGEEASVRSLRREDVINFYNSYCVPKNMVISISGDIDSEALLAKLKSLFGAMKAKGAPEISTRAVNAEGAKKKALEMDKEESLLIIGFKNVTVKDPDRYVFDVIGSILSGQSGRLFNELRDKRSLAYTLGCVQKQGLDAGYFSLYIATTKERIDEARNALLDQLHEIRTNPISDGELGLAKRELLGGYKVRKQTNDFFALESALDEIYGLGYENIYKYEDKIEKVTKEDIKAAAGKYLSPRACVEIVIAPK